eukprot:363887-Chlamydomonas_euryale.AAC.7
MARGCRRSFARAPRLGQQDSTLTQGCDLAGGAAALSTHQNAAPTCVLAALASIVVCTLLYKSGRIVSPKLFRVYRYLSREDQRQWDVRCVEQQQLDAYTHARTCMRERTGMGYMHACVRAWAQVSMVMYEFTYCTRRGYASCSRQAGDVQDACRWRHMLCSLCVQAMLLRQAGSRVNSIRGHAILRPLLQLRLEPPRSTVRLLCDSHDCHVRLFLCGRQHSKCTTHQQPHVHCAGHQPWLLHCGNDHYCQV